MTRSTTHRALAAAAIFAACPAADLALACGACRSAKPLAHHCAPAAPAASAEHHHEACILIDHHPAEGRTLFAYPRFTGVVPPEKIANVFNNRSTTVPVLNSRPGAPHTIFLDFDGNVENGVWADSAGLPAIVTQPFDLDGDTASFSSDEQNRIFEVWQRVSEDFAPFDVNVTTVEPPVFNNAQAVHVVFEGDSSWFGPAGGVAFLNSFYRSDDAPCWVFVDGTGGGWAKGMAEAASHEVGHTVGLLHQAYYENGVFIREYSRGDEEVGYEGPDAWAPIMGVGYNLPVVTWHNGPTNQGANAFQWDMAFLNDAFTRLPDDHGNTLATATPVTLDADGEATIDALIERNVDTDAFKVTLQNGGRIPAAVFPPTPGPNLDAIVELADANGVFATADPDGSINAAVGRVGLAPGDYAVLVRPNGDYGKIGNYQLRLAVVEDAPADCPGDATGDNLVNADDLLVILGAFGSSASGAAQGDLTGDGLVNADDLLEVLGAFGAGC